MQVILLERIGRLGQMGDVVARQGRLRPQFSPAPGQGAARHQGQPQALRNGAGAARGAQSRAQAGSRGGRRQARRAKSSSSSARPARPVSSTARSPTRDIVDAVTEGGFSVERRQVVLDQPIKTIGLHDGAHRASPGGRAEGDRQRRPLRGRGRSARHAARKLHRQGHGRGRGRGHRARAAAEACSKRARAPSLPEARGRPRTKRSRRSDLPRHLDHGALREQSGRRVLAPSGCVK